MRAPPRRAIMKEAELRRWARVAREEGVAIRGYVKPDGGVTITIDPRIGGPVDDGDDLDDRIEAFGRG